MAKDTTEKLCPECGKPLAEVTTTSTGRKIQRCSAGSWDPAQKKNVGCPYVKWLPMEPEQLDEKCPKCGAPLILAYTRFGKKMKKCSTAGWDKEKKQATGCDYIEWLSGTTEPLDEECPECGNKLVLYTTVNGKKMKKCSTAGWDKAAKKATGCRYFQWIKVPKSEDSGGEEFLPPEPTA